MRKSTISKISISKMYMLFLSTEGNLRKSEGEWSQAGACAKRCHTMSSLIVIKCLSRNRVRGNISQRLDNISSGM